MHGEGSPIAGLAVPSAADRVDDQVEDRPRCGSQQRSQVEFPRLSAITNFVSIHTTTSAELMPLVDKIPPASSTARSTATRPGS